MYLIAAFFTLLVVVGVAKGAWEVRLGERRLKAIFMISQFFYPLKLYLL